MEIITNATNIRISAFLCRPESGLEMHLYVVSAKSLMQTAPLTAQCCSQKTYFQQIQNVFSFYDRPV